MKALVIGCGNIGSIAAEDLAKNASQVEVIAADNNQTRAKATAEKIGTDNVSWTQLDISDREKLGKTLNDVDLAVGFLPGKLGYRLAEACIEAERDLVDVSYMAENILLLDRKASEAGVTIVPDCGLAPGISNVLVGQSLNRIGRPDAVHIMVGGLPEKPLPPLGYTITWSPESLIDEYTRKAGIIIRGNKREVEPLSGLEKIHFPGIGELEAFYTDGLRTLMHSIGEINEMWEKTLRYPGHADKIKLLKRLGFFDEKKIEVEGMKISPRKLTVRLLTEKLQSPDARDIVALRVEVTGFKNGKRTRIIDHMLDSYDEKNGITSMARTTAYPASIVAQLILNKTLKEKGVVPPEKIGMDNHLFNAFIGELEKRRVKIDEQIVTS